FQEEREPAPIRLRAEIAEGVSWLWHQRFMRTTVLLVAGSNFGFSALILILIVRAKNLGASPSVIGLMLAFSGAGALIGSVAAPWAQRNVPSKVVVIGSLWIWAAAALVLAIPRSPFALGGIFGVASIF